MPADATFLTFRSQRCQLLKAVPFSQCALVRVEQGCKLASMGAHQWRVEAGQMLVVPALSLLQVANEPVAGAYRAHVLALPDAWLQAPPTRAPLQPVLLGQDVLIDEAWRHWRDGVEADHPESVCQHRLQELLLVVRHLGGASALQAAGQPLASRVLAELSADASQSASHLARRLAMSEATLRRRLAAEGQGLRQLRESLLFERALAMVQTGRQPIGLIAEACGYSSAGRFAVRFRERFGVTPSALRATH
ncbi:helix-turn-helix domain-containing protein [Crenobacter caeni]|uniref:Helix-turn-helix domain-containing protein n=1 Tax=Crenobacter caeni TaxID=2705474 RepID=A0A6B2KVW1_9NEIS|nr:helix-turn-helix domain-containing protein [Crenobacter caeni]NDV14160.1 helix-turn-helix domain-containing protein [Crenobacter caeni]